MLTTASDSVYEELVDRILIQNPSLAPRRVEYGAFSYMI